MTVSPDHNDNPYLRGRSVNGEQNSSAPGQGPVSAGTGASAQSGQPGQNGFRDSSQGSYPQAVQGRTPYGQNGYGQSPYPPYPNSGQPGYPYTQTPPAPPGPYGQPMYAVTPPVWRSYIPRPSVTFSQAVRLGFSNYANFNGRASLSEFWFWYLFSLLVTVGPIILGAILALAGGFVLVFASWAMGLALFIPNLAILWRRMHDAGMSGAMALLGLIPGVGWIILLILLVQPAKTEGMRYDYS